MGTYNAITTEEEQFIREHIGKMPIGDIAKSLGRNYTTIQRTLNNLGIRVAHRWTKEEDEKLLSMYGRVHTRYIAHLFGVDENSVYNRIRRLRARKEWRK